ncbi:MAG TPA: acetyl-CoA carboxylase biotin carboxyl carrier protein [bacterium]|nr:acetyl-CoA carboxylase biotin carboxyl carrier protein [bacterium]
MSQERRLDLEEIRALIRLATEADITELDVDAPHVKVRIKKAARNPVEPLAAKVPRPGGAIPEAASAASEGGLVPITAPMVGTFYRAPKPDAPPFVSEGDEVRVGQTVCILEAMKLFNEISSDVGGRIARVLAENGAPVEYGQPLFLVDPAV